MDIELEKIVRDRLNVLPKEVSSAIKKFPWLDKVREIGSKYKFNPEQISSLYTEVAIIVLGLESPKSLPKNLESVFGLDENTVVNISNEIGNQILLPIKDLVNGSTAETLKSIPENKPETQEMAPLVVVEAKDNHPSINLIKPPVVAKPAEPLDLAPSKLQANSIVEKKLSEVVAVPQQKTAYPSGVDPYREPIN